MVRYSNGRTWNRIVRTYGCSYDNKQGSVVWALIFTLVALSGAAKACQDIISHKFSWSVFSDLNDNWWDPTFSWRNKYKYNNPSLGEKFFLSTTILVFVTDAWHMFQWIYNTTLWIALAVLGWNARYMTLFEFVSIVVICRVIYGCVFQLFYDKTLER